MAEIKVLEEKPISLPEVKEAIESISKRDKALLPKATKVLDYISKVNTLKLKVDHHDQEINFLKQELNFLKK